jgi:hypothetical protein
VPDNFTVRLFKPSFIMLVPSPVHNFRAIHSQAA